MKKTLVSKVAKSFAIVMSLLFVAAFGLTGCSVSSTESSTVAKAAGVLLLSVNPEIAIEYDENGIVTGLKAINEDAKAILEGNESLVGQETKEVVSQLVKAIGNAGYFVEEIEGEIHQIIIEIERGSKIPHDGFIDEVVAEVRDSVNSNNWNTPLGVRNYSDYGTTNYNDTNYDDTDYGPNNDGVTDYDDTDYGPNNDSVTDYDDTDYGPNNDGITDYDDTDYGPNNDGVTDYDNTDYGPNNDGVTDYNPPAPSPAPAPAPVQYNNSDYSDYGDSGYSDHGDSDYD